jgi:hypothetical protein
MTAPTPCDSAGGHNDSRTGAKGRIGIGGIDFFGWSLSVDDVFLARPCVGDHAQPLRYTWDFLAARSANPSANRSLIAFTAWSSFAHASLMAVQAYRNVIERRELLGVAALVIIGVALIALAPAKQSGVLASAAGRA